MSDVLDLIPQSGDFIVVGNPDGYVLERVVANSQEPVSTEKHRLTALEAARAFARVAKTRDFQTHLKVKIGRFR